MKRAAVVLLAATLAGCGGSVERGAGPTDGGAEGAGEPCASQNGYVWERLPAFEDVERIDAAVVASPGRVYVWGGRRFDQSCHSGGFVLDLATRTWRQMSGERAPSPRSMANAVWTGTELLVWGGSNCNPGLSEGLADGAAYDPEADTWRPMAPVPSLRYDPVVVWTGTEVLEWGGSWDPYPMGPALGYRYDPRDNEWRELPAPTSADVAKGSRGAWTGAELVVFGGRTWSDGLVTQGRACDLERWRDLPEAGEPAARDAHSVTRVDEEVLVFGGDSRDDSDAEGSTGGRYQPATDDWIPMSRSPRRSGEHRAVEMWHRLVTWKLYASGAEAARGQAYLPAEDRWEELPTSCAPSAAEGFGMVATDEGVVVAVGRERNARSGVHLLRRVE